MATRDNVYIVSLETMAMYPYERDTPIESISSTKEKALAIARCWLQQSWLVFIQQYKIDTDESPVVWLVEGTRANPSMRLLDF